MNIFPTQILSASQKQHMMLKQWGRAPALNSDVLESLESGNTTGSKTAD